jgi:hypothetical protein
MYPLSTLKGVDVTHISHYREICQYKVKCQEHLVKVKREDWQKKRLTRKEEMIFRVEPKDVSKLFL